MQSISLIIEDDMSFDNLKKNRVVPLYYTIPLLVVCLVALGILAFVFQLEPTSVAFQPPPGSGVTLPATPTPSLIPLNYKNLTDCGTISPEFDNNTYWVLNNSIRFSSLDCLTITASNVTINGMYRNITGAGNTNIAILVYGTKEVTLFGLNISNGERGISILDSEDIKIINNHINNSGFTSIYLDRTNMSQILGNKITSAYTNGIYLKNSNANSITQNSITGKVKPVVIPTTPILFTDVGLSIRQKSLSNTISNNVIRNFENSLIEEESAENYYTQNLFDKASLNSILISGQYVSPEGVSAYPSILFNNSVTNSLKSGISLYDAGAMISDLKVSNTANSYYDIESVDSSFSLANSYFKAYNFGNSEIRFYKLYSVSAESILINKLIGFTENITQIGANLSADIRFGSDYVYVNSVLRPGLNKSATIVLNNLPQNMNLPRIYRDGVVCPSNICSNLTSLNAGNVSFVVTGWSSYSVNATPPALPVYNLEITEPDSNERYSLSNFPIKFIVELSHIGSVKFRLYNGSNNILNNIVMNTLNNISFNYSVSALNIGNYTLYMTALFNESGANDSDSVNFRVTPNIVGNNNGSGNSPNSSNSPNNPFYPNNSTLPPPNNEQTIKIGNNSASTSSGNTSSAGFKYVAYWLGVSIIAILIVILIFLIIKAVQARSVHQNTIPGSIASKLR